MHPNIEDLHGRTFGRLTVEAKGPQGKDRRRRYWCRCVCGTTVLVSGKDLRKGHTRSCGCLKNELTGARRRTHGKSGETTYNIWIAMRDRCTKPQNISYHRYGGRGITVCDRWMTSFEAFLEDMGERPGPTYTLDRIANDEGYTPSNTRWSTRTEQARNRRSTIMVTVDGITLPLAAYAEQIGISYALAQNRHKKGLLRFDRAYDSQYHTSGPQSKHMVIYHGTEMPLSHAAKLAGLTYSAALGRFRKGLFPPQDHQGV
jgi:hypothetical protein